MKTDDTGVVAVVLLLAHTLLIHVLPANTLLQTALSIVYIVGLGLAAIYNHQRGSNVMVVLFVAWFILALVFFVL